MDGSDSDSSVVCGGELLVWALADEDDVVDEGGDGSAGEGAEPVHPVVLPDAAHHGGAEGDGRVHGGAVERPAGEDVGADDEADGDGRDGAEVPLLGVHGRGVYRVDEAEGHDDLEDHRVPDADAGGQGEGTHGLAACGDLEEEAGDDGAQKLGHPVDDGLEEADIAADEGAECHRRVHVPARDVGAHGHRHEQGQRVRQRRRDQPRRRRRSAVSQLGCKKPCASVRA